MYFLTKDQVIVEGREYTVYGMNYNDGPFAADLSTDKHSVQRLVEKCNEYKLEPIHMFDVIEDFLAEIKS